MLNMNVNIYFKDPEQEECKNEVVKVVKKYTPLKMKETKAEDDGIKYIHLNIYWDENPGLHYATSDSMMRWDSDSIIDPEIDDEFLSYLENLFYFRRNEPDLEEFDFGASDLDNLEFEIEETRAIETAKQYLLKCGNWTEAGYKECIRDAFTPFANRFKPEDPAKAVEDYYGKIITIYGGDRLPDSINNGIKNGLKSVFKVA